MGKTFILRLVFICLLALLSGIFSRTNAQDVVSECVDPVAGKLAILGEPDRGAVIREYWDDK